MVKQNYCPICESEMQLGEEILNNELVTCLQCGASLVAEIQGQDIKLKQAPEVEEDWGE